MVLTQEFISDFVSCTRPQWPPKQGGVILFFLPSQYNVFPEAASYRSEKKLLKPFSVCDSSKKTM